MSQRIFKDWISLKPIGGAMPTHTSDEWKDIVGAIEQSVPLYESVSERISFNLAGPLRRRAIAQLGQDRGKWVLDAGVGPGVSCRLLVSQGFRKIVGLDPSRTLLRFAMFVTQAWRSQNSPASFTETDDSALSILASLIA